MIKDTEEIKGYWWRKFLVIEIWRVGPRTQKELPLQAPEGYLELSRQGGKLREYCGIYFLR